MSGPDPVWLRHCERTPVISVCILEPPERPQGSPASSSVWTQGNRLSCREQEGRRGSEEAVPGPSVFPSGEPGVSGDYWVAWRAIPSPLSKLKRRLDSLEAAQGAPRCKVGIGIIPTLLMLC